MVTATMLGKLGRWQRREMGDPLGGCACAGARGAHNQLVGVRICRIDFWRRTFISRRRQRTLGLVRSATAMNVVMQAVVDSRMGGWDGKGGRVGGRIMGRVWKSLERSQPW